LLPGLKVGPEEVVAFRRVRRSKGFSSSELGLPVVTNISGTIGLTRVNSSRLEIEILGIVLDAIEASA
jgi:hypothetical protein